MAILVALLVVALSMGLLMMANGETSLGALVLTSAAGPADLISRLRIGRSIIR